MRALLRAFWALPVVVVFSQAIPPRNQQQPSNGSVYALEVQAMEAYDRKEYSKSVQLFDAAFSAGLNRSDDAYNAACSSALAGSTEEALAHLERAARWGFRDPDHMKVDTDLDSVRPNRQFRSILREVQHNKRAFERAHGDPNRASIVTSDIDLFWRVYEKLRTSEKPAALLEDEYFRQGTPGLQDFIFARIHSGVDLWKVINGAPKYYGAIRPATLRIKDFTPRIRASFRKLKELYPASTFPDVYFLIGRMNSAGTTGSSGLLIGADMFGKDPSIPVDELDEWHRTVVGSVSDIPTIVAHELIHYQQRSAGNTLLAAAVHEGSADFIGELISGEQMNQTARAYGLQHESELWTQFSHEMYGTDTSHWMYEGKVVNGRPADLAYFVGYRIAQAYYDKAPDKKLAIEAILNFEDADRLLRDSGYAERFKEP